MGMTGTPTRPTHFRFTDDAMRHQNIAGIFLEIFHALHGSKANRQNSFRMRRPEGEANFPNGDRRAFLSASSLMNAQLDECPRSSETGHPTSRINLSNN